MICLLGFSVVVVSIVVVVVVGPAVVVVVVGSKVVIKGFICKKFKQIHYIKRFKSYFTAQRDNVQDC